VREGGAGLDALGQGRFDIVGWDLRGTGASTYVRCFENDTSRARFWGGRSIPATRVEARRYLPRTIAFARRCGERSGRLLGHISTADTARDLDYLRRLVGDRRLTYLGISAGTFIGQTYVNMFPRRVRAMVLDGVLDPVSWTKGSAAALSSQLTHTDLVFAKFVSLCQSAGPARCALAGHGHPVVYRVTRLLARLRRAPISAPSATPPGRLTYSDALTAIAPPLSVGPTSWRQLAEELEEAAGGDGSALATAARKTWLPGFRSLGAEQDAALRCADGPARQGSRAWPRVIGRLTRVSRIGGRLFGWSFWAPCASWPARSASRYTGPWNARTTNPILVIGTRFDPVTPFSNARRATRRLGNAVLLTHDGYGHTSGADPSACVDAATSAYLVNLTTPPLGTVCPSDRQPFDPSFGKPLPVSTGGFRP
jgi:pimeloyl-ACP methyl ester carboxylesterase